MEPNDISNIILHHSMIYKNLSPIFTVWCGVGGVDTDISAGHFLYSLEYKDSGLISSSHSFP